MTATATAPDPTTTPTIPPGLPAFVRLSVQDIYTPDTNPRKHFDDAALDELARSLKEKGQIEPVVVRLKPHKKGPRYELVVGERRWRAAVRAGLDLLAVVREYSDEEALEIQLIENLHRKDLTPLEEAIGYRRLIDSNPDKHSAMSIAGRIGMSVAYVWDLLSLNNLIPEAKLLLEEQRISKGHAILIARQTPADQKALIKPPTRTYPRTDSGLWEFDDGRLDLEPGEKKGAFEKLKTRSVRELQTWIEDHIRFDVEHAAKVQPFAFEHTAAQVQQAQAEEKRGAKVLAITHDYRVGDDARDEDERTYGSQSWKRADGHAKSKTCEYSRLGLVVAGEGQGDSFLVCVNRDKCTVHFAESVRAKAKAATLRAAGKTKQAAKVEKKQEDSWLVKRRREEGARKLREDGWKAIREPVIADAVAQVKAVKTLTPALAEALLKQEYVLDRAALKAHLGAMWYTTPVAALLVSCVAAWEYSGWNTTKTGFQTYVDEVAKPFGLDLKRLEAIRDKHAPAPAKKGAAA